MNHRRIRGLAAAGLLCAALLCTGLAGCGTAAAATAPAQALPEAGAGGARLAAVAAPEAGCASVKEATSVTVMRRPQGIGGVRVVTQHNATLVRALFRDFCAVLAHAGTTPQPAALCAARGGPSYAGTFHDGKRVLASFAYRLNGCPLLRLTASGKTRVALVIGKAAAAAPHLKADLAAVFGPAASRI